MADMVLHVIRGKQNSTIGKVRSENLRWSVRALLFPEVRVEWVAHGLFAQLLEEIGQLELISTPVSGDQECRQLTFSSHSHLEALFEPTVLALITMMLVNWTIATSPTGIS